jgi:predicted DNA-binding protein
MARGDKQLNIRLPEALKDRITAAAQKNRRSVNSEILDTLETYYPEPITIEDTARDIRQSIQFIRAIRGHETFRVLAEEVDRLLDQVLEEGLLSPEQQEEARKRLNEHFEKRLKHGQFNRPDSDEF